MTTAAPGDTGAEGFAGIGVYSGGSEAAGAVLVGAAAGLARVGGVKLKTVGNWTLPLLKITCHKLMY